MNKNTLTLTFEEIVDPESGKKFIAVAGTIIKRILDKDGNTIPVIVEGEEDSVEFIRIDFMQPADDMAKNLSKMAIEVTQHGIENYEKRQAKIEAEEEAKENALEEETKGTSTQEEKTKA